ncbi:MAG: PAS domain-containing protein [Bdellovibrionales bacterium]|nr:PAS domain-containing protein [Bdellovibrionales bacterium]
MSSFFERESDFKFDELFFSRTDRKGIIQSANSIFQRVSKYEWDEILKRPHNIIRHPAMPRGVFHLFWEMILNGKPVGAYVVNKSKDGSYYWVYALASPIDDGFLSIRLKPSSPIFEVVKQKYAELLELEKTQSLSPKDSQAILLQEIQKLGFDDYSHFMTEALTKEIECRQQSLDLEPIGALLKLRKILSLGQELQKKCEEISLAYQKVAFVPLNLEVQAAKIGQEAATISIVSSQYDEISKQIQAETEKFLSSGNLGNSIKENVQTCQFDVCNLILTKELVDFFTNEVKETPLDKSLEMTLLQGLGKKGIEQTQKSLTAVESVFQQFTGIFREIGKLTTALDIVGITGKVEAVKVKGASADILGLLEGLMDFKTALKSSLKEIDGIGSELMGQTKQMKDELKFYLNSL